MKRSAEKKVTVKDLQNREGTTCIYLEDDDLFGPFPVPTELIRKFGITQGAELRMIEEEFDMKVFFGQNLITCIDLTD